MSKADDGIKDVMAGIESSHGAGSVMMLGSKKFVPVEYVPTVSIGLDEALGVGGIPRGRVIEVYGPESGGKTTLTLHIIAKVQKLGGRAAFIDAEHALDPVYAAKLGVDIDNLIVSQPDNGEQALEITKSLIESGKVAIVVVDSVAALVPKAELEGDMGDPQMGLQARLMSQALRKLTAITQKTGTILIFINQIREKIGVMFGCFHYNTRVVLSDGTTEKIGKIVNQRLPVEVLSVSPDGKVEPRPVIGYHNNGQTDHFIAFEVESDEGSGKRKFSVTENHVFLVPSGEASAADLHVGDYVLDVRRSFILSESQTDNMSVPDWSIWPAKILKKYPKPLTRGMNRFDLTVDVNHNYLADHIVAHNSPETTTGGRALKFYASVRLDIRKTGLLKSGDVTVGSETRIKVVKNKVAAPFREAQVHIIYGEGISREFDLLLVGGTHGIVEKSGTWLSYKETKLGQGAEKARLFLVEHPDVAEQIETELRNLLFKKDGK